MCVLMAVEKLVAKLLPINHLQGRRFEKQETA
jgi:hypothetical protein